MRNLKEAKEIYDHIVVPEELDARLRKALETTAPKKKSTPKIVRFSKWVTSIAAAFLLCFTLGLNTSKSFAMEMSSFPVLGPLAKVLTIRSYTETKDTTTTTVEVPEVQLEAADTKVSNTITDVNAKIQALVEEYTAKKHAEIEEYKKDFFETGGTQAEWEERSIDVNVNYEVKHQSETMLSLLIDSWISWFNFEEERHFYNIDLITGEELSLTDFFGADAYDYVSDCVLRQMNERIEADPENVFYWGVNDDDAIGEEFIGVTENTLFYVNEAGNVVITYDEYEVSPGYMGIQEFVIPTR